MQRRNLLLSGVTAALAPAVAASSHAAQAEPPSASKAPAAKRSCDVVVIGAGAAGSAAALAAQQSGARTILLEKLAFQAGAGSFAGGMFAADSAQQKAEGKVVSKQWLFNEYMSVSGAFVNTLLVRRIIDEAGATVDWLNENGCRMRLVSAGTGGGYAHIGKPATLHGYQEGGAKALQGLLASFRKAGGEAMFSTPATGLILDANGRVTGVRATSRRLGDLEISARAVIICSGGFGGNPDMMREFIGEPFTLGEVKQNTGEGVRMAWAAGAGRRGQNVAQYFWETFCANEMKRITAVTDDWWPLTDFTRYPNLRVNINGERFSDETNATLYSVRGAQIHMQPEETEFVILDSAMLETIRERGLAGVEEQYRAFRNRREFFMEFNAPNDTDELSRAERAPRDLRPWLDAFVGRTDTVFRGDSIEALARAMKVPAEALARSVAQYNEAARTGIDPLFFADGRRLLPVGKAPFYAIRFVARNLGTLGGIRVSHRLEAETSEGRVIPGLYAAGADAGGMYGQAYVDFEGGTLGFAYTSGRLAGLAAAESARTK